MTGQNLNPELQLINNPFDLTIIKQILLIIYTRTNDQHGQYRNDKVVATSIESFGNPLKFLKQVQAKEATEHLSQGYSEPFLLNKQHT